MKLTKLSNFLFLCFTVFFLNTAFSDVNLINTNACEDLEGQWSGQAKASAFGGFISCKYKGIAIVKGINKLLVELDLIKTSGASLCNSKITYSMTGNCSQNNISFKSKDASIVGYVINDGVNITAKLKGKVNTNNIKADIDVDIIKNK